MSDVAGSARAEDQEQKAESAAEPGPELTSAEKFEDSLLTPVPEGPVNDEILTDVSHDNGPDDGPECMAEDVPPPEWQPTPVHHLSISAFEDYMKAWVRKELHLHGTGHTEPERAKLNP